MINNKLYSMLGLAKRAGKCFGGTDIVVDKIRKKETYLTIIAEDASDNTKKRVIDKCNFYKADYIVFGTCETLGNAIGTSGCAAVTLTDNGFAQTVFGIYKNMTEVAENGSC